MDKGRACGSGGGSEQGPLIVIILACRIQRGGHTLVGRLGAWIGYYGEEGTTWHFDT